MGDLRDIYKNHNPGRPTWANEDTQELELTPAQLVAEHKGDYKAFYNDPLQSDEERGQ